MLGKYQPRIYNTLDLDYVGIKTPQFSYHRLKGANLWPTLRWPQRVKWPV